MITIEESIDISVPVSTANAQWEAFEASFEASQDGAAEATFLELDENRTRVIVQIAYDPESLHEPLTAVVGAADRRITDELESFKEFIEHPAA